MPEDITGELNNTAPVCQPGVDNQGGTVEADSDLEANASGAHGHVDVAKFPEKAPGKAEQKKAAEKRAASSPSGGDKTPQTYHAVVPFSTSSLQLGSSASAGGCGASITTQGNVFVGATGKLGMQSLAAFTGQTNDTQGLYSTAGTIAHSQSKFEIFAGGGDAPGACGVGSPAVPKDFGKPAANAEKMTNAWCNALGVVKAGNDIRNAAAGASDTGLEKLAMGVAIAKGSVDAVNKGSAVAMGLGGTKKETAKTTSERLDTASGLLNIASGVATALTKPGDDPAGMYSSIIGGLATISGAQTGTSVINKKEDGPVEGSDGAASKVPPGAGPAGAGGHGAAAHGGGGPLDIEKRSAAQIHQCCNIKITGNAPEGIDWKVGGAYLVNAIASVEFSTTNWGAFAAFQFKIRAGAKIEVKCRKFEMKALARGLVKTQKTTVKASKLSTLDGDTFVTKTLTVEEHSTLHDELNVIKDKDTVMDGNLKVEKEGEKKGDLEMHKAVTFRKNLNVNGKFVAKNKLMSTDEGMFN